MILHSPPVINQGQFLAFSKKSLNYFCCILLNTKILSWFDRHETFLVSFIPFCPPINVSICLVAPCYKNRNSNLNLRFYAQWCKLIVYNYRQYHDLKYICPKEPKLPHTAHEKRTNVKVTL